MLSILPIKGGKVRAIPGIIGDGGKYVSRGYVLYVDERRRLTYSGKRERNGTVMDARRKTSALPRIGRHFRYCRQGQQQEIKRHRG